MICRDQLAIPIKGHLMTGRMFQAGAIQKVPMYVPVDAMKAITTIGVNVNERIIAVALAYRRIA